MIVKFNYRLLLLMIIRPVSHYLLAWEVAFITLFDDNILIRIIIKLYLCNDNVSAIDSLGIIIISGKEI